MAAAVLLQFENPSAARQVERWLSTAAFAAIYEWRPDVVAALTDSLAAGADLHGAHPGLPLILIPQVSSESLAIEALRSGIFDDYVTPWSGERIVEAIRRTPPRRTEAPAGPRLVGTSRAARELRASIERIARAPSNVLITGETGTGKELVAQLIHVGSPRSGRPLVAVNCAAVPDTLLESELFGFERGAFTGAVIAREGKLRQAAGGAVFLDEIGEMSPAAQAKVLRVIETRNVEPLGGSRSVPVDFRVISATNRDLRGLIAERRFREDLFFRLSVATIELPPLRDRKEDIPGLAAMLVAEMNVKFGMRVVEIDPAALEALTAHDWPGNIRELRNVVEAAFIHLPAAQADVLRLPPAFGTHALRQPVTEEDRLRRALEITRWNKSEAARQLQWSRMTLYRKMAKYQLLSSAECGDAKASVTPVTVKVTTASR